MQPMRPIPTVETSAVPMTATAPVITHKGRRTGMNAHAATAAPDAISPPPPPAIQDHDEMTYHDAGPFVSIISATAGVG